MTVHKQFQYPVSAKKAIDVQFNLEYDGNIVHITTIQIHGNYYTGLPTSPELKKDGNEWKFYQEFETREGDEFVRNFLYHNDDVSKGIIENIFRIKEEETPRFTS